MKKAETEKTFHIIRNEDKIGARVGGDIVLPCIFDDILRTISAGHWIVKKDGKWGYYGEKEGKFSEVKIFDGPDDEYNRNLLNLLERLNFKEDLDFSDPGQVDKAMKHILRACLKPNSQEVFDVLAENESLRQGVVRLWSNQKDYKMANCHTEEEKQIAEEVFYNRCSAVYASIKRKEEEVEKSN